MAQHDENFYEDIFEVVSSYQNLLQEAAEDENSELQRLERDTGYSRDQIDNALDKVLEPVVAAERFVKSYGGEKGYIKDVQAIELPDYTRHALKHDEKQRYVTAMIDLESR